MIPIMMGQHDEIEFWMDSAGSVRRLVVQAYAHIGPVAAVQERICGDAEPATLITVVAVPMKVISVAAIALGVMPGRWGAGRSSMTAVLLWQTKRLIGGGWLDNLPRASPSARLARHQTFGRRPPVQEPQPGVRGARRGQGGQ